jgi:hypothetical protein
LKRIFVTSLPPLFAFWLNKSREVDNTIDSPVLQTRRHSNPLPTLWWNLQGQSHTLWRWHMTLAAVKLCRSIFPHTQHSLSLSLSLCKHGQKHSITWIAACSCWGGATSSLSQSMGIFQVILAADYCIGVSLHVMVEDLSKLWVYVCVRSFKREWQKVVVDTYLAGAKSWCNPLASLWNPLLAVDCLLHLSWGQVLRYSLIFRKAHLSFPCLYLMHLSVDPTSASIWTNLWSMNEVQVHIIIRHLHILKELCQYNIQIDCRFIKKFTQINKVVELSCKVYVWKKFFTLTIANFLSSVWVITCFESGCREHMDRCSHCCSTSAILTQGTRVGAKGGVTSDGFRKKCRVDASSAYAENTTSLDLVDFISCS